MNTLKWLGVVAGVAILTVGLTRWLWPKYETVIEYEQAQVDENTWARRSVLESERELTRRLRRENTELARQLVNKDAVYSRITGRLNTELDSIRAAKVPITVVNGSIKDTTITVTATFGEGLFVVQSENVFTNNELTDNVNMTMTRPVRIDVLTTISDMRVTTYVSSRDFTELNFETYTTIKPPRVKWYHWLGAGVVGGVVAWEIIR
jgi:ATP-dependent 26S proteasome regulatory subunit